ncbi:polysaccharide export protein (CAP59) [Penicillium frequentans]|nr:polysaccharide export protein (CAP59) [Penicillium glabrum]
MLRSRLFQIFALIFILWSTTEVFSIRRRLLSADTTQRAVPRHRMRIYVASIHWNNEEILRSHWNDAILHLAEEVGSENMFLSIFESGSWDGTKSALRDLDRALDALGVARNITMSEKTHHDEVSALPAEHGWVDTPQGRKELRRIPYLAGLRNLSLQPLYALLAKGIAFDWIVFLNDVVFTSQDVLRLLDTNQGEYAAACSLDFSKPPSFYDTFALRDSYGQEHVMQTWPYFRSSASRNAMTDMNPVPVASCWNGIVSMPASPFYADPPLEFRGVSDSLALAHVEGSECCLIHADNPLTKEKGVYLNPQVRVGYNPTAYSPVHPANRWVPTWQIFLSLWENRIRRVVTSTSLKEWVIRRRVQNWEAQDEGNYEPGQFCLINEMQVLRDNGYIFSLRNSIGKVLRPPWSPNPSHKTIVVL